VPEAEPPPAVDARLRAAGTRIDLDGLCRWFGAGDTVVKAVDDVNLHVDEAAFVVVLGPSGSDKTTLLNLIGALDAPTAGTIRLAGRDLTSASRAERTLIRRHTVSFIFQSFNLFPALTALENVQFGADVAGRGATLDSASAELLRAAPARVTVSLDSYYQVTSPVVAAVRRLPAAGKVQPGLLVPGTVLAHGRSVGVAAEVLPPGAAWTPALSAGHLGGGLVLSRKAATDLGVGAGDVVTFRHPRAAAGGLVTASSVVRVTGIDPSPMRAFAYLTPVTAAPLLHLAGMTNLLTVLPAPGHSTADVWRALLNTAHVASVQSVRAATDGLRSSLDQFTGILNVAAGVALLLVFLIAFNTASIGTDERSREHATMMAFGLPIRTVLGLITTESVLVGAVGTVIGLATGYGLLAWLTATTISDVMPEIGVTAALSAGTMAAALLLGAATVAAAPLFTLRRLRRTDVPSTLRVAE
jgi:putative ABC transport system permease protein